MGDQTTAFVKQYEGNIRHLAQQEGTKLRSTVQVDTNFKGDSKFYDQLGKAEMQEITSRHGDTPWNEADHRRRKVTKKDYDINVPLDTIDQLCMFADPKGKYSMSSGMAAGRKIDQLIIDSYIATAYTGKEGDEAVSFTAGNQIAHGDVGMTKAKLLSTKKILDDNDVSKDGRVLVLAPEQTIDLLNTTEVGSIDFNAVKSLVDGTLTRWLGFDFIQTTLLSDDGSSHRLCYAYHNWAMQLAIQKEPTSRADQRKDKRYMWQVYTDMSMGATRLEEERIVQISCLEA